MDNWLEVSLTMSGELAEAVADVLARFAPNGVMTEQAVGFKDDEDEGTPAGPISVRAYLPANDKLEETRQKLEESLFYLGMIQSIPAPVFTPITGQNWMEAWKKHYKPIPIGKRLMILPAWLDSPDTSRIPIKIDPGMAFGTGTHPTTQLCLELLEKSFDEHSAFSILHSAIIDVGCGSGILSIAGLKLGASSALGLDIDEASIRASRENARVNGIAFEQFAIGLGSVAEVLEGNFSVREAPIVVANILAPVIIRLFGIGLTDLVTPGGTLILSGILAEQAEPIVAAAQSHGLQLSDKRQLGDWVAMAFEYPVQFRRSGMKARLLLVSKLAVLCLLLCSCSCPGTHVTFPATDTPTLLPPPTDTPTLLTSATPTPTDTGTPPIPPIPYLLTPTLAGPAMAHFVSGQKIDITYIHMVDVNQGWGIGGLDKASDHVFRTQDGGQTWRDVTPPQPAPSASNSIAALGHFLNADTGWVAYGPTGPGDIPPFIMVWSTHDGGGTWTYGSIDTSLASGEAFSPWYLNFADTQHGWLMVYLGAGMMHNYVALFATSDGGATWSDILDPYSDGGIQSFSKTGMVFVDPQTGWLTRDGSGVDPIPHIFRSQDGGVTWTHLDLPAPANTPDLYNSYACGSYSPNAFSAQSVTVAMKCLDIDTFKIEKDYAYFTSDGGITWQVYPLPADYTLGEGLYFSLPQSGLALGRKIYKTIDGGQTWKFIQQVFWDGQFSFISMDLGWAYVINDQGEIALVKTVNGGETWTMLHPVVGP